jgi:hypothetical protein
MSDDEGVLASDHKALAAKYSVLLAERDQLRARLHELMARDVDAVDLMNIEYGCPDCGVHHACGKVVAERDRLRAVVDGVQDRAQATAEAERDRLRAAVMSWLNAVVCADGSAQAALNHLGAVVGWQPDRSAEATDG